jgi:hypothetical protein
MLRPTTLLFCYDAYVEKRLEDHAECTSILLGQLFKLILQAGPGPQIDLCNASHVGWLKLVAL